MSTPEPPPFQHKPRRSRRFQFNTATLLGVMALVAVGCMLAVTVPSLFGIAVSFVVEALVVAYAAVLLAGAWTHSGNNRLFFIAALGSLLLLHWSTFSVGVGWVLLENFDDFDGSYFVALGIQTFERFALSLFSGWVALRAARYWQLGDAPSAGAGEGH